MFNYYKEVVQRVEQEHEVEVRGQVSQSRMDPYAQFLVNMQMTLLGIRERMMEEGDEAAGFEMEVMEDVMLFLQERSHLPDLLQTPVSEVESADKVKQRELEAILNKHS